MFVIIGADLVSGFPPSIAFVSLPSVESIKYRLRCEKNRSDTNLDPITVKPATYYYYSMRIPRWPRSRVTASRVYFTNHSGLISLLNVIQKEDDASSIQDVYH